MNVLDGILKSISDLSKRVSRLEGQDNHSYHSLLSFGTPTELTIAVGAITITGSYHTVDTEGDGATDDLDTINGGVIGDLLILQAANDARSIVIKDGTGNIFMPADMTLDNTEDVEMLLFDGTNWVEITGSSNV